MASPFSTDSPEIKKEHFSVPRLAGSCTGMALGCGISFITTWVIALILSAVLVPLFGNGQGQNTPVGTLVAALTCAGSLILGAGLSFLTGRLFPIFKKKAG